MSERSFDVFVVMQTTVRYTVDAMDEEDARCIVESSDDADAEFGPHVTESSWYVACVEPVVEVRQDHVLSGFCGLYIKGP